MVRMYHSLFKHWPTVFSYWLLWIILLWTLGYRLCENVFSFLCNECPRGHMLGCTVRVCYLCKKLLHSFPGWCYLFTFPLAICKWSNFSCSPVFGVITVVLMGVYWYLIVPTRRLARKVACVSLTADSVEHLFTCLFAIHISSSV